MKRKKTKSAKPRNWAPWIAATLALYGIWFFIADKLISTPEDLRGFNVWMGMAHDRGLLHVYDWTDLEVEKLFRTKNVEYPPLIFVHYFLARMLPASYWSEPWPSFVVKALFRGISLVAQFLLVFAALQSFATRKKEELLWFFLFFVLNPALYLLGITLGQYDILVGLAMYLSLNWYLEEKPVPSALMAAAAVLFKPTALLLLPLLFILFWKRKGAWPRWIGIFLGAVVVVTLPWTLTSGDFWLVQGFRLALVPKYLQASPAAFNLWWGLGHLTKSGDFSSWQKGVGVALAGASLLLPFGRFLEEKNEKRALLRFATLYFLAYVLFTTNVTGKHLVYAMIFASFWALEDARLRWCALALIPLSSAAVAMNGINGNGKLAPLLSGNLGLALGWLVLGGTAGLFAYAAFFDRLVDRRTAGASKPVARVTR